MRLIREENPKEIEKYSHIQPAPIWGPVRCFAPCPGTRRTCTLEKGHAGPDRNTAWLALMLPRQDVSGCWKRIRSVSKEQLKDALEAVAQRLRPVRRHVVRDIWEPQLTLQLAQRHFYAQRMPTYDGEIKFDVDTLSEKRRKPRAVKAVPAWLEAIHTVLAQTNRANFEMPLKAVYPLVDGSATRRADFPKSLVTVVEAFQPFLKILLAKHT